MRIQTRFYSSAKVLVSLLAGIAVMATTNASWAFPSLAANCAQCHTNAGGDLNIDPNPLALFDAESASVTFEIAELPGPGALSITGLAADGLNATVDSVPPWTARDSNTRYTLSGIDAVGARTLDLTIGPGAAPGHYPISVFLAGNSTAGQWSTSTEFIISVIPEPTSLVLLSIFLGVAGMRLLRKRRKGRE